MHPLAAFFLRSFLSVCNHIFTPSSKTIYVPKSHQSHNALTVNALRLEIQPKENYNLLLTPAESPAY